MNLNEQLKKAIKKMTVWSEWEALQLSCEYNVDMRAIKTYYLMIH